MVLKTDDRNIAGNGFDHWPLGYGPSTLPLRHPASTAPAGASNPRPLHLSSGTPYKYDARTNWVTGADVFCVI